MANRKPHIWFLLLMTLYFSTRLLRSYTSNLPIFLEYYFTDLLFIPTMASFSLIFIRKIKRDSSLLIPNSYILIQTVLISVFFEFYLPFYSTRHTYTSDPIDILMYFLGALLYLLIQRFRWI